MKTKTLRMILSLFLFLFISFEAKADNDVMITRDGSMMEVRIEKISSSQVNFIDLKHKKRGSLTAPTDFVYMIMKEKGNNIFFDEEGNQTTSPVVEFDKKDNVMFLNRGEMLIVYNVTVGKDDVSYQLKDKKKAPWIKTPKGDIFMVRNSDGTTTLYNDSYQKKRKREREQRQQASTTAPQTLLATTPQTTTTTAPSVPSATTPPPAEAAAGGMQLLASETTDPGFHPAPEMTAAQIEQMVNARNPYTLYRKGAIAEYCFQYNDDAVRLMGFGPTYVQQIVADEKIENGLLVAYIKQAFFNKKHEPSKGLSKTYKDYLFPTEIDTAGTYHLTHNILQDFIFTTKRQGYCFLVPGVMTPGMNLKCSTLHDSSKNGFGGTVKLVTVYSGWKVEAIENITTPAGTFECVKLTGHLAQDKVGEKITCWMARGIGIVRYESIADSSKKQEPFVMYLNKIELK